MATFSIALSGLTGANSALDITSNNIANANTTASRTRRPSSGPCSLPARSISTPRPAARACSSSARRSSSPRATSPPRRRPRYGDQRQRLLHAQQPERNRVYAKRPVPGGHQGNVVSATGQYLQVYPPLANGGFNTGALSNLNLNTSQSAPVPTSAGT